MNGARELVFVTRDGVNVGGGTFGPFESMARFWHIGVRDADPALIEAGVADAVYHRVITLARERGFKALHVGHSRPFVRDGVFEYKRQFGAHALSARVDSEGSIEITPLRFTPAAVAFLSENPVIAMRPDRKYCLTAFVNGSAKEERIAWWRERYCFAGTLGMRLFDLTKSGRDVAQAGSVMHSAQRYA